MFQKSDKMTEISIRSEPTHTIFYTFQMYPNVSKNRQMYQESDKMAP